MITMYIQYAKNDKNQLVIACYHEKIQSISAAIALARKFAIPVEALQKREVLIANLVSDEVKAKLLELLQDLRKDSGPIQEVYFNADLNLCSANKEEPAPFLFDKTINNFFAAASYVHLTLESLNHDYVKRAIALADSRNMVDLIIKTKSCIKNEPILKSYPSSVKENKQPSFFNSAVKAPVNSPGGEDGCYTLC